MPTPHNQAEKSQIAKKVLMPGDPLRAKFIAETFLENPELVNSVRNIYAYTGTYKGERVTVMASVQVEWEWAQWGFIPMSYFLCMTWIRLSALVLLEPMLPILH